MKDLQSVPAAWENDSLCLHQLFKIQAEQVPDNIALVDGDVSMTYRELDRLTDALAGYLQQQGVTFDKIVGIFLETGDALKITQTPHALFISFDRAIVEEFRFGENRPINVGQADAIRVSGWEGGDYVVETLGEKRMKLTDRYSLSADGQLLTRHITLRSRQMEEVTIVQKFDRKVD